MSDLETIAGQGRSSQAAESSRRRDHHYPALDGLRGVAFLAVFAGHYGTMIFPGSFVEWGGWLGVDLFFVLSGFLITGILFDSLERPHYFRTFYIRRALRIFPLYYVTWIVFLILTPWLHPLWNRFDLSRVLYVYNLMDFEALRHPELSLGGFFFHTPAGRVTGFNVGPLWSLSLEEQFYLVWPLLLFMVRDRVRLMWVCGCGIAASLALNVLLLRWAMRAGIDRMFLYNATYAHASPMLIGALLALWLRGQPERRAAQSRLATRLIVLPGLALIAMIAFVIKVYSVEHPLIPTLGYLCSGTMSAGLVLAAIQQGGFLKRMFSLRPLMSVGVISYGLYIIHGFLMSAFSHHLPAFQRHHVTWLLPISAFAVAFSVASLSYRYFETPFLRLKDRWAPTRPVGITGRDPSAPMRKDGEPVQAGSGG